MIQQYQLEFNCIGCQTPVQFSIFAFNKNPLISCSGCSKKYNLGDKDLKRQLKKFEALCHQIHDSEEILSKSVVAIQIGSQEVEVPYKLLLTRLTSRLQLNIGDEQLNIAFRTEPTKE